MKQAVIYTRYSPRPRKTKNGELVDSLSCEFQETKGREYCQLREMDVLAVYRDKAISGKSMKNRPGLEEALGQVCKERAVLVCYNMARLARSVRDLIKITDVLDKHQADIVLVTEQLDTTTPMGRLVFHVMAAIGQFTRESTGEHTSAMLRDMQRNGLRTSNRPRFGWKVDPKDASRVIRDGDEQDTIATMIRLRKQGIGNTFIARALMIQGRKPRGERWHGTTVRRILARYN